MGSASGDIEAAKGTGDVYPVQAVQVVKVDHVIVQELGPEHEIAHHPGIVGNGHVDGVFYSSYRAELVHVSTHPAQSLGNQGRIVGVTAGQDVLDAAK